MTSRLIWKFRQLTRRVWFRATVFSLVAVVTALVAAFVSPFIPSDLPTKIGADAVDNILGIIAASMLTVTTFSLSTMVAAYAAATSNVTPRATKLLMEDTTTQTVLATFIGSFLFSLVGIVALSTGVYGESGRVVLFGVTILVIIFIVVTLLRWIDHLSRFGRVAETTQRVEDVAVTAMRERHHSPYLGGRELRDPQGQIPQTARSVSTPHIGYVQHVDMAALSAIAGKGQIYVHAVPGGLVDPTRPIARFVGIRAEDEDSGAEEQIRKCFTIGDVRSFDQDPRFGVSVLAEVASRALSPATNDLGTAIDVMGRSVRVLAVRAEPRDRDAEAVYENVFVPALQVADLFDDFYIPIARDGATLVEIGVRLQKSLATLSRLGADGYAEQAARHSLLALERFEQGLTIEADRAAVRRAAEAVGSAGTFPSSQYADAAGPAASKP